MERIGQEQRVYTKTKSTQLRYKLPSEFDLALRIAQAVLEVAEAYLSPADERKSWGSAGSC